jgi:transaldolase
MAPNEKLAELSDAGVAVWLDDLSRDRIRSGGLQSLVDGYSVVGVTTNPAIFAAAISASGSYDDQVHAMAVRKASVAEALRTITKRAAGSKPRSGRAPMTPEHNRTTQSPHATSRNSP